MLFSKTIFAPEAKTLAVLPAPDVAVNLVSFVVCELRFTALPELIKNIAEHACVEPTIKMPLVVLFEVMTLTV